VPVVAIIDDQPTNLRVLCRFAVHMDRDVQVLCFASGGEALQAMVRMPPDLIVTDYVMPGISGRELIRKCREATSLRDVPIIVVTAYEDKLYRYEALDAGATDFLLSPVDGREFCTRARNLLTLYKHQNAVRRRATSLESELKAAVGKHASEIEQRERMVRRIVNTVPALVRASDAENHITLINDYHGQLFGICAEGLDRVSSVAELGADYAARHSALDREVLRVGRALTGIEEKVVDDQGVERVLLTTKAPLTAQTGRDNQVVTVSLDITERKRSEQALAESEQRFRSLIESSVLGIVIAIGDQPLFANQTFAEIFGYAGPDEVLALGSLDSIYAATDLTRIRQFRDARKRQGIAPSRYEFQGRRKDGSLIWVETVVQEVSWNGQQAFQYTLADVSLRKEYEERLYQQANFDDVTGLPNRILAFDRLRGAIVAARRYGFKVAVLYLDLDQFKKVNDTYGHDVGDQLLLRAAERLSGCVRASDTVARLGGDEYLVILSEMDSASDVETVIHKVLEAFSCPFVLAPGEVSVTASIGVTLWPEDGNEPHVLLKNADSAMYKAKDSGRNTFNFYTIELHRQALERMRIESLLLHALERDELRLHFQPILDIRTGILVGAEALLRWSNPELGVVEPERFIPLSEDTGLIVPIGRWVINQACRQLREWQSEGLPPMRISVNISMRQLPGTDLVGDVNAALKQNGLSSDQLELEITESLLMNQIGETREVLKSLVEQSVRLSLDDFGTGYSSLSYLRELSVDALKIDKSFVSGLEADSGCSTVVEAIIAMAHRLGIEVVAEGIESEEQLARLRAQRCDLGQGYLFSRPLAPEAFRDWVAGTASSFEASAMLRSAGS
jgi:diguanylate cyclase (GGDEF)-like protein/PAS domain S-box-containing protein